MTTIQSKRAASMCLPKTFSPHDLFSPEGGLTVWRGPVGGENDGREGNEAIYEPLGLTKVNMGWMVFENFFSESDSDFIDGEVWMARILEAKKPGLILLGVRTGIALWQNYQANRERSHLEWLYRRRGIDYFFLLGTIMRKGDIRWGGSKYILCFSRCGGEWNLSPSLLVEADRSMMVGYIAGKDR